MSSADPGVQEKEEGPKESAGADIASRQEHINNDNEILKEHGPSSPTVASPDVPVDVEQATNEELEEEQMEEAREELERQRRENTQEDQDQRNEDSDLVQEEMVSEFQEGKKRVKVNIAAVSSLQRV